MFNDQVKALPNQLVPVGEVCVLEKHSIRSYHQVLDNRIYRTSGARMDMIIVVGFCALNTVVVLG